MPAAAPVTDADLRTVAMVGDALALRVDGERGPVGLLFEGRTPPPRFVPPGSPCLPLEDHPPLVWSPPARALVIFLGARRTHSTRAPNAGPAAAARRRFHGEAPSGAFSLRLPALAGPWVELGEARRIDYESDKWGRGPTGYQHAHGPNVRAFLLGDFSSGVLAVRGGRLALTPRGIVG